MSRKPSDEHDAARPNTENRILILPPTHLGTALTARQRFLHLSQARSHAAKVSRARAKSKRQKTPGKPPANLSSHEQRQPSEASTSIVPYYPRPDSGPSSRRHGPSPSSSSPVSIPQYIGSGGLDPFLPIAADLPIDDRLQLHTYLNSALPLGTGTTTTTNTTLSTKFNPTRYILIPKLALSTPLVYSILLISSATRSHPGTSPTEAHQQLTHRRALALHHLRAHLLSPLTSSLPATLVALVTLIAAESRVPFYSAGQHEHHRSVHGRGLKAWLDVNGGLAVLDAPSFEAAGLAGAGGRMGSPWMATAVVSICVHFGMPGWETGEELEGGLERLWLPFVGRGGIVGGRGGGGAREGERKITMPRAVPTSIAEYCYPSTLGSQVAVLYVLAVLQVLAFWDALEDLARMLGGTRDVPSGTMLFVVLEAVEPVRRRGRGVGSGEGGQWHVLLSNQRIVETVSLLALLGEESRARVVRRMVAQLVGAREQRSSGIGGWGGEGVVGRYASERHVNLTANVELDRDGDGDNFDMDALKEEIRSSWLAQQRGSGLESGADSGSASEPTSTSTSTSTSTPTPTATSSSSTSSSTKTPLSSSSSSLQREGDAADMSRRRRVGSNSNLSTSASLDTSLNTTTTTTIATPPPSVTRSLPPGHPPGLVGRCPYHNSSGR